MSAAHIEDHPTDPNKVVLRKKPYLDKGADYEHGFIDGMQYQMQSSVDRAVNVMVKRQCDMGVMCIECPDAQPKREWVGLTDEQKEALSQDAEGNPWAAVELAEAKLKELNT